MMDWIKNLKPGDTVVVDCNYGNLKVAKVDRVTPTGRIVIGASTFNPDGWLRGSYQYDSVRIREATVDLLNQIHQKRIIRQAQEAMRSTAINYDQAVKILEVLAPNPTTPNS